MIVIISDLHLTDGSTTPTLDPRAFGKFCRMLRESIGDLKESGVEEVQLVFLGDTFDIIRSKTWLDSEGGATHAVRPWSPEDLRGETGREAPANRADWTLRDYTMAIVRAIIANNQEGMERVRGLVSDWRETVSVKINYIVGNHDWLLNRYPEARKEVAAFLGMEEVGAVAPFPLDFQGKECRLLARHGDIYDPANYDGNRDASSLGDAVVIDLLSRFVVSAEAVPELHDVLPRLKQVDFVRPMLSVPWYIISVARNDQAEKAIVALWRQAVRRFLAIPFVTRGRWRSGTFIKLYLALMASRLLPIRLLGFICDTGIARRYYAQMGDMRREAHREALAGDDRSYIVYGHTHNPEQVALDKVAAAGGKEEKIYFNSGTWQRVYEHACYCRGRDDFLSWRVMTFLIFYGPDEKRPDKRRYEVWTGSLGRDYERD